MTSEVMLQLCTEDIWQGTMEHITRLGIQPAELPEEALTQIYQVRPPRAAAPACMQACAVVRRRLHGYSQSCISGVSGKCTSAFQQSQVPGRRPHMPDIGVIDI